MSEEIKLREAMSQAHAGDEVPTFDDVWRRAEMAARVAPPRRPVRYVLQGSAALALVALVVWLMWPTAPPLAPPSRLPARAVATTLTVPVTLAALTSWRGPTDFLLNTLETDLLSSTTQVGNPSSLAVPGLGELNFNESPTSTQRR